MCKQKEGYCFSEGGHIGTYMVIHAAQAHIDWVVSELFVVELNVECKHGKKRVISESSG